MWLQMVATSIFALGMAVAVMAKGLPPIAYTIPDRLAVFKGQGSGFGAHVGGIEALAGLRPL